VRLIILSDLTGEQDVVSGLNMALTITLRSRFQFAKPSRDSRLVAHTPTGSRAALNFERLMLNTVTNRVTAEGVLLNVRGAEYRLLEFLMSHPGRTFNRTQLLAQVWAGDQDIDERTVDVNVQRLRKILRSQL